MATKTWAGGATGNWNVPSNWSPSGVPVTGDDVVINTAGCEVTLDVHIGGGQTNTGLGSLTILAGTLDTNDGSNRLLTVTGVVTNNGTLTLNGSTVNLGSTSAEAGDFQGSGTFNLDTSTINFHTASSANFTPSTSANFDTNTSTLNLIGLDSSTRAHNFTFASGNLHNVTTSRGAGSGTHIDKLNGNCTITGNLTVGANSKFSSGTRVFTVNGDVSVTGELDCDDSDKPMTFGSLTIASGGTYLATSGTTTITDAYSSPFALNNSGTFTHNSGTLLLNRAGNQDFVGTWDGSSALYNLTIDGNGGTKKFRQNMLIEGDLDVTASDTFTSQANTETLTVNGNVNVSGTLGATTQTGAYTFGSLGIDTGGTFIATSGTTTITTGGTVLGQGSTSLKGEGTFTHNNGTLVFDSTQYRIPAGGTFYNVKMTGSHPTGGLYCYSGTLLPQPVMPDGTTEANAISILGTLEITEDEFRPYNTNKLYIHNLVIGDGTGLANSAKFDMSSNDLFDGKVFVDNVTIHSDGQLLFGDGDETSSTEGSSALNIYGAFRNLGGSVDIT